MEDFKRGRIKCQDEHRSRRPKLDDHTRSGEKIHKLLLQNTRPLTERETS